MIRQGTENEIYILKIVLIVFQNFYNYFFLINTYYL